jgi:hypothetical protein
MEPLVDNRFGNTGQDLPLSAIRRAPLLDDRFQNSGVDLPLESVKRSQSFLLDSGDCRPTVWVARWSKLDGPAGDEMWMVSRVWNDPTIDLKEIQHPVRREDLIEKVKELLGVPASDTAWKMEDVRVYDSEAEDWCIKKVYDLNGEIQGSSRTMNVNERGMSGCFDEVARVTVPHPTAAVVGPDTEKRDLELPIESIRTLSLGEETELSTEPNEQVLAREISTESPRKSKKEKREKKKGKKEGRAPQSIWELLAPPPVVSFVDSDNPE